jgi:polar amino acid transport system substrate-binding protein
MVHTVSIVFNCCPNPIRIGWSTWPPYHYIENEKLTGKSTEIAIALFNQLECDYNFVEVPWFRIMHEIEHGYIDAIIGATYSQERSEFAYFSEVTDYESLKFYARKNDTRFDGIESLEQLLALDIRFGLRDKVEYGEQLETQLDGQKIILFNNNQLANLLLRNRIDVVVFNADAAEIRFQQDKLIALNIPELHINETHIMLSKKTTELALITKTNQAITQLNQTLATIRQHYQTTEIEASSP